MRCASAVRCAWVLGLLVATSATRLAGSTFVEVTVEAGLATAGGSSSASWGDYDADGCIDLFVSGSPNTLYRNDCNGAFDDVTSEAGITGPAGIPLGAAWGDYDNDRDLDLYIGSWLQRNVLYRNDGNGSFTDVSEVAGVNDPFATAGVSWGDYDHDGDLDLFVANRFPTITDDSLYDRLYRNNGNGTFTDVAGLLGIRGHFNRKTFMGVWADLDGNGTLDLYLSVDFGADVLYMNQGNAAAVRTRAARSARPGPTTTTTATSTGSFPTRPDRTPCSATTVPRETTCACG